MGEREELEHNVTFPMALRVILCAVGAFIAFMMPYELWRGVWPLNIASPFFAMFIIAGWGGAFAAITMGLGTSQRRYVFRHGALDVTETWVSLKRQKTYDVADIVALHCKEQENSDGPNMHYVEIAVKSGATYKSRMFDTEATARKFETGFRRALGM